MQSINTMPEPQPEAQDGAQVEEKISRLIIESRDSEGVIGYLEQRGLLSDITALIATATREAYERAVERYVADVYGPRCKTKDTDDFPELEESDPQNRCACCEAWDTYDSWLAERGNNGRGGKS
jgi:hypothetical protein